MQVGGQAGSVSFGQNERDEEDTWWLSELPGRLENQNGGIRGVKKPGGQEEPGPCPGHSRPWVLVPRESRSLAFLAIVAWPRPETHRGGGPSTIHGFGTRLLKSDSCPSHVLLQYRGSVSGQPTPQLFLGLPSEREPLFTISTTALALTLGQAASS